ncbi:hypothetical protein C8Q77DRAFT_1161689 [Trametes polyzona]|nr:hypothetical protein C8Q77DRAFT_1161689 [Trametes polyzona]
MSGLAEKLGQLLSIPPIAIELLPGDSSEWIGASGLPPEATRYAPFLFFEGNLGVLQKLAYKAYLKSVPKFTACREQIRATLPGKGPGSSTIPDLVVDLDPNLVRTTLESSAILLLVNPAHESALNARKRLVACGAHDAAHELRFVSALLTLREGAKQSVLWRHRRWLLRRLYPPTVLPHSGQPEHFTHRRNNRTEDRRSGESEEDTLRGAALDADAFRAEFAAVAQACEVYPRNYHGWAHRYLCAEALSAALRGGAGAAADALREVWREEEAYIRRWIERHVSDYSAMQYACRLEQELNRGGRGTGSGSALVASLDVGRPTHAEEGETVCEHALALVKAYPTHESLWLYLRGALSPTFIASSTTPAAELCRRTREEARAFAEGILSGEREGVTVTSDALPGKDELSTRGHAARFNAWLLWKEGRIYLDEGVVRGILEGRNGKCIP